MQTFNPMQYLAIDVANSFGLDKKPFSERIQWFKDHASDLESLIDEADEPAQFMAGMLAYQDTLAGQPSGYLVGLDATASGIQLMSALTGCKKGGYAVNLIDPSVRVDGYTYAFERMKELLGQTADVSRADIKQALMCGFYGSEKVPKDLFGEDTPELNAFYTVCREVFPGAWALRNDLIALWQPFTLSHDWTMPDGFEVKVKVMETLEKRFNVDELKSSFTHIYQVNRGSKEGLSLAANIIHSFDGLLIREMARRADYDEHAIKDAMAILRGGSRFTAKKTEGVERLLALAEEHRFVSARLFDYVSMDTISLFPEWIRERLVALGERMLSHKPYCLVMIHDMFKCLPAYMQDTRQEYVYLLAELAESTSLDAVVSQIAGTPVQVDKLSDDMAEAILGSNYALS